MNKRKKVEEVQILVDLPEELVRELERQAQAENVSVEELLERFIKQSLSPQLIKRIKYH
jgi:hypothetical protein